MKENPNKKKKIEENPASISRRKFLWLLGGAAALVAIPSLINSCEEDDKNQPNGDLGISNSPNVDKSIIEDQNNKELANSLMEIMSKNNFWGNFDNNKFDRLTIGIEHATPEEKLKAGRKRGASTMYDMSNEIGFSAFSEFFEKVSSNKKIVFVIEGTDTEGRIMSSKNREQLFSKDFLLPKSLKNLKADFGVMGVDKRTKVITSDEDLKSFMEEYEKIWEKIKIKLSVPEGADFDIINELYMTPIVEFPAEGLTEEEYSRVFTYGKLFSQINDKLESDTREINEKLIKEGYFPINIIGATHSPNLGNFVVAQDFNQAAGLIYTIKKTQYLKGMFAKDVNKSYKPKNIPKGFEKYKRFLKD